MTRTAASARALMRAADPLPAALAAGADAQLEADLAELLARVPAADGPYDPDVWELSGVGAPPARGRRRWAGPTIAAASVVLATAVAISIAVAAEPGHHSAPAGGPSAPASSSLSRERAAAAAAGAARSAEAQKLRARSELAAQAAARTCAREVGPTLRSMIAAYRQVNGGKAAALHQLQMTHAPSSLIYSRDAAAFGDWLTRGGPAGRISIESAVARACIQ